MSYQVHNFVTGDVIEAAPINEMDQQILINETNIAGKLSVSEKGAANGIAELDSSGKVKSAQLPSYVDDIIDGYYYDSKFYLDNAHTQEITGETGKIYVDLSTNNTYRWSGSIYVLIGSLPVIMTGATSSNAGTAGYVPVPAAGDNDKCLKGNGTWTTVTGLPDVTSSDNGKVPMVVSGEWSTQSVNAFTRQYWSYTNSISISMTSGKNYFAWTAGSNVGTSGEIMDTTSGSLVFISNGSFGVIYKGSGITISEGSGTLTISSSTNVAMGVVEL